MTGWVLLEKALTVGGQSQLQSPVLSNPVVCPMQRVEIRQQLARKVLEPETSRWWESLHTHTQFLVWGKAFLGASFLGGEGGSPCSSPSTVIRGQWLDEQRGDQLFLTWQLLVPGGPDSQVET